MKRGYPFISLFILCLPFLVVGLIWERLPLQIPMHFTVDGQPDRFGTRSQWVGMLVSTTLFLTVLFRVMIHFLPHRLTYFRIGAVYLISAIFIVSLNGILILKTLLISSIYTGLEPILFTLFGSALVYFSTPSFMPVSNEIIARRLSPGQLLVRQKIYRLSRFVVVRVNALMAPVMVFARPDDRWLILVWANVFAFLGLILLITVKYGTTPDL